MRGAVRWRFDADVAAVGDVLSYVADWCHRFAFGGDDALLRFDGAAEGVAITEAALPGLLRAAADASATNRTLLVVNCALLSDEAINETLRFARSEAGRHTHIVWAWPDAARAFGWPSGQLTGIFELGDDRNWLGAGPPRTPFGMRQYVATTIGSSA